MWSSFLGLGTKLLGSEAVANFGGKLLGGLGSGLATKALSPSTPDPERQIRLGYQLEGDAHKTRRAGDFDFAESKGLTPQEFYGSGAAGGSPTGGSAQVLGNSASQQKLQERDRIYDATQKSMDRAVQMRGQDAQLQSTQIAANASQANASTSAEASKYSANIQKAIADGRLSLDRDSFNQISLPAAAANLEMTEQQTRKLIEETATATPKFQRSQKLLSMGVDNTIQTALLQRFGVDITSKSEVAALSDDQFQNILAVLLASGSHAQREGAGILSMGSGIIDSVLGRKTDHNFNLDPMSKGQ